eukprot:989510-Pyramimonas_sp.AAC.1
MRRRCGGRGRIAKECKASAKLQSGRMYKHPSLWSSPRRSMTRPRATKIRSTRTRIRTRATKPRRATSIRAKVPTSGPSRRGVQ